MAFMISVVHNFVNNDCTPKTKQKNADELKLQQPEQPKHCPLKTVVKKKRERTKNHQNNNPALFLIPQKENNEIIIIIKFGLTYLK
jgi:hypothetical protein